MARRSTGSKISKLRLIFELIFVSSPPSVSRGQWASVRGEQADRLTRAFIPLDLRLHRYTERVHPERFFPILRRLLPDRGFFRGQTPPGTVGSFSSIMPIFPHFLPGRRQSLAWHNSSGRPLDESVAVPGRKKRYSPDTLREKLRERHRHGPSGARVYLRFYVHGYRSS